MPLPGRKVPGRHCQHSTSSFGFDGPAYGILIPLRTGKLKAHLFAVNVSGKILWANNSRRIYFSAQQVPGSGNSTVYRLDLNDF